MTKRVLAFACAVLLVLPMVAPGAEFTTFFPPSAQFAMSALTTSSVNNVQHAIFAVNLANLDLFVVFLGPTGIPTLTGTPFVWAYGTIISVQFLNPHLVRVSWRISGSTGGINAVFVPAGTITQDFVV